MSVTAPVPVAVDDAAASGSTVPPRRPPGRWRTLLDAQSVAIAGSLAIAGMLAGLFAIQLVNALYGRPPPWVQGFLVVPVVTGTALGAAIVAASAVSARARRAAEGRSSLP